MKIRELLIDESKWTQGVAARDKDGAVVSHLSDEAVSYCLHGALYKCYQAHELDKCYEVEEEIMKKLEITTANIAKWNDAPERKFEEVRALIEELDI